MHTAAATYYAHVVALCSTPFLLLFLSRFFKRRFCPAASGMRSRRVVLMMNGHDKVNVESLSPLCSFPVAAQRTVTRHRVSLPISSGKAVVDSYVHGLGIRAGRKVTQTRLCLLSSYLPLALRRREILRCYVQC